jgi:hypothetical protein
VTLDRHEHGLEVTLPLALDTSAHFIPKLIGETRAGPVSPPGRGHVCAELIRGLVRREYSKDLFNRGVPDREGDSRLTLRRTNCAGLCLPGLLFAPLVLH